MYLHLDTRPDYKKRNGVYTLLSTIICPERVKETSMSALSLINLIEKGSLLFCQVRKEKRGTTIKKHQWGVGV